jgi:Stage II sporulation protein E (SpoIIE)
MSNRQAVVKALASENTSPKELVEKVNRVMWRNTMEGKFITLFYGLLDVDRKTLQYANAGHNAPVLTREDGVQVRLEQGGLIVGAFQESVYDQGEIELQPGDRLVMFTDGLSEAVDGNGEEFGEERLAEASLCNRQQSAEALHRCLLDRVTDFCGGEFEEEPLSWSLLFPRQTAHRRPMGSRWPAIATTILDFGLAKLIGAGLHGTRGNQLLGATLHHQRKLRREMILDGQGPFPVPVQEASQLVVSVRES